MNQFREVSGDLFVWHAQGTPIAVTTSGLVSRRGRAQLGRGCARACGERFPWFADRLGSLIRVQGLHTVHVGERLIAFPVEPSPFDNPDLGLIMRSARELVALTDQEGWSEVALPRPGCGTGGLAWKDVSVFLAPILDDRFVIVTRLEG
jgi:hypothetical protein